MKQKPTLIDFATCAFGFASAINAFICSAQQMYLSNEFNTGNFNGLHILISIPFYLIGVFILNITNFKINKLWNIPILSYALYFGIYNWHLSFNDIGHQITYYGLISTVSENLDLFLYISFPFIFTGLSLFNKYKNGITIQST